ncbi:putative bifunctional diguanylate cyclase/phosphodiesterase [Sphingosinicella terrae]|uniref:putative bifunctional diguanylate cyclase/phosphodiesterase n=1 Tax=Sphingosinicella terrae TaxID=2172047 RepID=UPI0013B3CB81|nr:EAL domain-containing protein [Sphingosinicella terrae]
MLTNFATVSIVREGTISGIELFRAIWPISLTSAVAIVLVMSFLYRSLVELVMELEAREAAAQHLALHDQLTSLANRALLEDRLGQALNRYRRTGEQVALLMLDLDRFKQVNDTLGHNAGDKLVQEVGERLRSLVRETDTVARIGGDEFAIVQIGPKGEADIRRLCERIIAIIREPFVIGDREARVGVSIGAVFASRDVSEASELLRKADITMYRAKAAGRDCFRIFTEAMDADVQRRDRIESSLRAELRDGDGLQLYFQPLIGKAGTVVGLEGLLRWHHPTLGQIAPAEVIPIAEECALIDEIGLILFRKACAAARRWPHLSVAVNLSPGQFRTAAFPSTLRRIADEEGVEPRQIELEITETLFIEHGSICAQMMTELRRDGFKVTLDDFGTGYSSLSSLRSFEVDKIKLDRSFIDVASRDQSVAIIRAAVTLGHAMNLDVVAEGISTIEEEQIAVEAGCDALQGYLYAPAMPEDEIDTFLAANPPARISNAA